MQLLLHCGVENYFSPHLLLLVSAGQVLVLSVLSSLLYVSQSRSVPPQQLNNEQTNDFIKIMSAFTTAGLTSF